MSVSPFRILGLPSFLAAEYPKPVPMMGDWLCRGEYVLLSGPSGAGKSLIALSLGLHLACGTDFLDWHVPTPVKVLLIDGEMAGGRLQERIKSLLHGLARRGVTQIERFDVYPLDAARAENGAPLLLSDDQLRHRLVKTVEEFDVVILDNFYCFFRGDENEAKTWQPVNQLALEIRSMGKTVILIHHVPKSRTEAPSGHSMNERSPDTSLVMIREREEDIQSPISLRFRKLRHVREESRKLRVQFHSVPGGVDVPDESYWSIVEGDAESRPSAEYYTMARELHAKGMSTREIEREIKAKNGGRGPGKTRISEMVKHS